MKHLVLLLALSGLSLLGCEAASPSSPTHTVAGDTCVPCPPDDGGDPGDQLNPGDIVYVDGKPYSAYHASDPPAWGAEAEWTGADAAFVDQYGSFQIHGTFRYDGTAIRTEATVCLSSGQTGVHPRGDGHEFALEGELSTVNTYMNSGCDLAGNVFHVGKSEIFFVSLTNLGILKLDEATDDDQANDFFGSDGGAAGDDGFITDVVKNDCWWE
jgi:hypothetical protein